ncbi:DUF6443 domain-containing protein [Flavobacterium reichenbachii]|uniref:DUF6443 domain-containing protein n=1 Tax=Flavobacterium reichenbachii TaxID=362418 RepID=UPI0013FE3208|nr:DUF6443 domain-containing protein [Flavobacterium reichenbachii]
MRKIINKTVILLVFSATSVYSQTPVVINKPEPSATDYIVTGNETLTATQTINLKPGTWIKSGSTFLARITADVYIPVTMSNENYIFTRVFQSPITDTNRIVNNKDVIESISYFDGLGRPMQNIAIKASPNKEDLITHIAYDGFGRQDKDYLPFMMQTGAIASYRSGADASTSNYYTTNYPLDINPNAPNPFSQKKFEDSPLNRLLQQAAPGKDWALGAGHEINIDYMTNQNNDIKLFNALSSWNNTTKIYDISLENAQGNVFYPANELYITITQDENRANTTQEVKDKEGRVILKRTYGTSIVNSIPIETYHDTYYVYDSYGNLIYVIPPKADGAITASVLNDLCYQYKYDHRNRLAEKKLPGKDWEYIVYDKLDRPVLTQDANLRAQNKWLFAKYDAFGRPVYTGEYSVSSSRKEAQDNADNSAIFENRSAVRDIGGTNTYYSNNAFPNSNINLFTINYYDNYNNIELEGANLSVTYISNAKGLITVSKVRILGTLDWSTDVNYYDNKGRIVYTHNKNNYLKAITTAQNTLDFAGKVLETVSIHKKGAYPVINLINTFTYDHMGRMLSQKQKINQQPQETIASNTYDNLGQLVSKAVGGGIQNINYKYNIRGWLKNINDVNNLGNNLFAFQLNYNTADLGTPLYNGNISQTYWRTANKDNTLKSYTYHYDELNRLIDALGESADQQEKPSYDKNGNIMSLYRTGIRPKNTGTSKLVMQIWDNLTYHYDQGNKLIKVEDSSDNSDGFTNKANLPIEYTYDANGNMKTDANKAISSITYNHLNLPTTVTLSGGTISYAYDATGVKQRKTVSGITTDYTAGFQYENDILQFFPQSEGYVSYNNGNYEYIYQYKDHLGNVRLTYNKNLSIIEENNYYPFGLKQLDRNNVINFLGNSSANKYKYNGKELQDELQLNVYDYGARNYDPALGRWMNIDPLAEKMRGFSPYNYTFNNPMRYTDPDGMSPYDVTLTGDKSKEALAELQKAVGDGIKLSMNHKGNVSYERNGQGALNKDASDLVNAIDDHSVIASVNSSDKDYASNGDPLIGNQMGATVNDNGTATGNQEINPNALSNMDAINGKPGQTTLHETMEAFTVGKTALNSGQNIAPATWADGQNSKSPYRLAHDNVIPQSGENYILNQNNQPLKSVSPSNKAEWQKEKGGVSTLKYVTRPYGSNGPVTPYHTIKVK